MQHKDKNVIGQHIWKEKNEGNPLVVTNIGSI
jgi:hypothetical protein